MSGSKKYYSAIYQRFGKVANTQEPAEMDEPDELNHTELDDDTKIRYEYAEKLLEKYTWNKRDAKELLKLQIELIESYFKENSAWSKHTMRSYQHIITDFVTYSPTIDPSELKNFIYSKFKIKGSEPNQNIEMTGTPLSYAQWISKFLCRIYENTSFKNYFTKYYN